MNKPQATDYNACRNRTRKISAGGDTYSRGLLRPLMRKQEKIKDCVEIFGHVMRKQSLIMRKLHWI